MRFAIRCNGTTFDLETDPDKPLLWVLREDLGFAGVKFGCGIQSCGACKVLIDGEIVHSCRFPVSAVGGREVTTIEGLNDPLGQTLKDSWIHEKVSQCGYCQPGQIISAYSLITKNSDPSDSDIDNHSTNICRCGTYQRIRSAIKRAAKEQRKLPR